MSSFGSFLTKRLNSIRIAFRGASILLRSEASLKVQFAIAIVMTIAGFYFDISRTEWMIQILVVGGIMTAEGLNTAIERLSDFIQPEFNSRIGMIKDVSAGAVFIMAVTAIITGGIIYLPKIF